MLLQLSRIIPRSNHITNGYVDLAVLKERLGRISWSPFKKICVRFDVLIGPSRLCSEGEIRRGFWEDQGRRSTAVRWRGGLHHGFGHHCLPPLLAQELSRAKTRQLPCTLPAALYALLPLAGGYPYRSASHLAPVEWGWRKDLPEPRQKHLFTHLSLPWWEKWILK